MKRTIDEHATRFDEKADAYDQMDRPVYETCVEIVLDAVQPRNDEVVLDIGTGTGAIAVPLARNAGRVVGRDISTAMLDQAREKAAEAGLENIDFDVGRFRELHYDGDADIVTTNYALHHLDDASKRNAIETIAAFEPRQFVLGDLMLFGERDPDAPDYDPDVDDPATVGRLADAITAVGFDIVDVIAVSDQAGVIVAQAPRDGWEP